MQSNDQLHTTHVLHRAGPACNDGEWSEPEVFLHWWISCHIRWAVRDYPRRSAGKRDSITCKIQDILKS